MAVLLPGTFGNCLGYQQITSLAAAAALTVPAGATMALVQAEAENVRWRDDGTAPTATVGMILFSTDDPQAFSGGQLRAAQFIALSAGSILNVSYYS